MGYYYPKHKLCSQKQNKKSCILREKRHFGKKEVAGFSHDFFLKRKFQFSYQNSGSLEFQMEFQMEFQREYFHSFILIFQMGKGKKSFAYFLLDKGTKTSDGYFIFVNRIATELVK